MDKDAQQRLLVMETEARKQAADKAAGDITTAARQRREEADIFAVVHEWHDRIGSPLELLLRVARVVAGRRVAGRIVRRRRVVGRRVGVIRVGVGVVGRCRGGPHGGADDTGSRASRDRPAPAPAAAAPTPAAPAAVPAPPAAPAPTATPPGVSRLRRQHSSGHERNREKKLSAQPHHCLLFIKPANSMLTLAVQIWHILSRDSSDECNALGRLTLWAGVRRFKRASFSTPARRAAAAAQSSIW